MKTRLRISHWFILSAAIVAIICIKACKIAHAGSWNVELQYGDHTYTNSYPKQIQSEKPE